ncbi:MAG: hypothetical protein ACRERV_14230, partial [Methylococcales bacterium]
PCYYEQTYSLTLNERRKTDEISASAFVIGDAIDANFKIVEDDDGNIRIVERKIMVRKSPGGELVVGLDRRSKSCSIEVLNQKYKQKLAGSLRCGSSRFVWNPFDNFSNSVELFYPRLFYWLNHAD